MSILAGIFIPAYVIAYTASGAGYLAAALCVAAIFMIGAPVIYKLSGSLFLGRELFIVSLFVYKLWEITRFGGVVAPGAVWLGVLPIAALLLGSAASAMVWLAVAAGSIIGVHAAYGANVAFLNAGVPRPDLLFIFSLIGLYLALFAFMLMFEFARKDAFTKLESANRTIHELATRDPLTGVYNRRHVWSEMGAAEALAERLRVDFCICLFDLDNFKRINDTHGHAAGDAVLKRVAEAISEHVRHGDCFGRYGGEEFILLLNNSRLEEAGHICARLAEVVKALRFTDLPAHAVITVSGGVAEHRRGEAFAQTVSRADAALYAAKAAGKSRLVAHEGAAQAERVA